MMDAPLTAMITTLSNVRSLASTASSGTLDDATRQNTISQLTAFREQLADYGNTQIGDQYIFAGTKTTTKPFDRAVQSPPDTASYYNGNDGTISIEIDAGVTETTNIPGSQVLTGPDVNILKTLDELIDKLENNPTDITGMQALTTQLDDGAQQLYNAQVTNGNRITRIAAMDTMLSNSNNTIQTVFGDVQNADYAKLAVQLQQQTLALEATLSTTAKVSQMSLLDYL
jgi:flagellar hook-associated protein 3 FlgL